MQFSFRIFIDNLPLFLNGLLVTLKGFGIATITSLVVGLLLGSLSTIFSKIKIVQLFYRIYISIFRNTPLLVQLFFLFYGLPLLGISFSPLITGVVGITLNEGAFIAEIINGNIKGIPYEDWETAEALGLTKIQTLRYIIFPQAWRDSIPALTGQISIILKDTSLFSLIMINELIRAANIVYSKAFDSSGFLIAAGFYIILFLILSSISLKIERRFGVKR